MGTRIYTRSETGQVIKFEVDGKIGYKTAKDMLQYEKIKHKGAVLLIYFKV